MFKRAIVTTLVCLLSLGLTVATPGTAEAKKRKKSRDTPGCVTRWEYNHIGRGQTMAYVTSLLDTGGSQIAYDDDGFWSDDSYWEGAWVSDGYYDEFSGEWVDLSYYDEYANYVDNSTWVSMLDTVRSYKKCKSWNRGRGRVGIEFDNYTFGSGMRVFTKTPRNPSLLNFLVYLRATARTVNHGKPMR